MEGRTRGQTKVRAEAKADLCRPHWPSESKMSEFENIRLLSHTASFPAQISLAKCPRSQRAKTLSRRRCLVRFDASARQSHELISGSPTGFFSKATAPAPSSVASTSSQASKAKNGTKAAAAKAPKTSGSQVPVPISSDVEDAQVNKSASFISMQKAKESEPSSMGLTSASAATSEGDTNASQMDVDSDDESPVRKVGHLVHVAGVTLMSHQPGRKLSKKRSVVEEGSSDEAADTSARLAMSKSPYSPLVNLLTFGSRQETSIVSQTLFQRQKQINR